jgi:type IV secretion system protein VirD4
MSRFASAPWPLKAAYLSTLAALASVAFAGVTGFVALLGLHRLSAHLDVSKAPAWFWYFRGDPKVQRWLSVGALASVAVGGALALSIARNLKPPLHGAARWANEGELRRHGLRAKAGIMLGRKGGRPLVFGGHEHVMLYAPTRSGKGVGIVIPNLLTWPDSVVVLDVKRENWEASAGFRAGHGQRVILFDPLDPEGLTARFNPLGHIDRANPSAVLDELQKLSVMLFPTPQNADPFWAEAARTGFIGVGAYVAETPTMPFSLGVIYRELTAGDPRARLPAVIKSRAKGGSPLSPSCVSALTDFCSASENTFASIKQTITARMNLWLNPRICAATDVSDFDLRDLRRRRMSLYLCVSPDNLARVAPLYALLLQQLVDLNTRERPSAGKDDIPVLLLLDEFARLGAASVIAHGFSYVAGYGLRLLPVLQSPAQLRALYGPDLTEEIMANCGVEIAFAPKELKIAQDLSERLGTWTYAGRSRSRPSLLSRGSWSTTESDQRRPLMLPQEILQMPPEHLIVLKAGMPAARGRKIVYWRERRFARRVKPPPAVEPLSVLAGSPCFPAEGDRSEAGTPGDMDPLSLSIDLSATLPPLPEDAGEVEVQAWVDAFIDASAISKEAIRA